MSESIGIEEEWIEKGWTEEQMMNRVKELNLPIPWCSYQPYVLNFLQTPDMNQKTLQLIEESRKIAQEGSNAWIAATNLWPQNKPINIVFSSSTHQEFIKATLLKYLQPHISMQLNFPGGSSGDILVNVISMSGAGGNSAIGRTGKQQTVNLNGSSMASADMNSSAKFHWPKYLVCHEFGHAMGLWHEWNREQCSRGSCSSTQDSYSVMNYPAGSSGGAGDAKPSANCMDNYSPMDIEWLEKVYGKGPGGSTGKPQPPQPTGKPQPPQPTGKPQPPQPTGKPRPPQPTGRPQPPRPQPTGRPQPPRPPQPTGKPQPSKPPQPTGKPPPPVNTPSKPPGTTSPLPGTTTTTPLPGTTSQPPGTTSPLPGTTTQPPGTTSPLPGTTSPLPGTIQNVNLSGTNLNTIIIIVTVSSIIFFGILFAIVKFSKKT